jgi:hypothetical protein
MKTRTRIWMLSAVAVVYNRPAARGRKLFGGIVPYGQVWNPGADEATRLETNQDVRAGLSGSPGVMEGEDAEVFGAARHSCRFSDQS